MSKTPAGAPEILELTIEREFAHPPEAVFAAWTDEKALRKWMGPGEVKAPVSQMDAREGGAYVFPMVTPDGKNPTARGKFLEIVPNKKLRFTWSWDQEDGSSGNSWKYRSNFRKRRPGRGWCCIKPTSSTRKPVTITTAAGSDAWSISKIISPAKAKARALVCGGNSR